MRLHIAASTWQSLLCTSLFLTSSLLSSPASAKKDSPSIKENKFPFIPFNVNYFEDSDVVLFEDGISHNTYRSADAGESWEKIKGGMEGKMFELVMHQFDHTRAYIITEDNGNTHYKTSDRGETWEEFSVGNLASIFREVLTFHAGDPDRIIFNGMDCTGIFCEELTLVTTDGFKSEPKFLRAGTSGCHWAKSTDLFTTGQKDLDDNRILCVVKGRFSPWRKDYRLLVSDNYFQEEKGVIQEFEPELEAGRTVQGIVNMAVVKPFLIVAASAEGTDEMAMYVSDDTIRWHRAIFPHDHKLTEEAYTVLEGTNYSIQIDVMNSRPSAPMGVFLSSNSNGTYFARKMEHTDRNVYGLVDFEKITGIQGVMLINTVENWEAVDTSNAEKKIKTQISFDDGNSFEPITYKKKELHLHSVTDLSNSGRVFSSPAPGLVMGIGNTGSYLKDYSEGNLYVSDDAGLTWHKALDGPHKYEFGDQGSILVAVKDEGFTDEIKYSIDHGKNWKEVELETKLRPIQLTTTQDSTSLKFILEGIDDSKPEAKGYIVAIDFDGLHERQCKDDDMEKWYARVDENGQPTCIMGQKQSYRRRKADADCFLKQEFKDPQYISEECECTDADFECDYNFIRSTDRKECNLAGALALPEGECKAFGPDDTFKGSSGWRKIPGNKCKRTSGKQKDDPIDRKCVDAGGSPPATGNPDHQAQQVFSGKNFKNKVYLERSGVISTGDDETVLVLTEDGVFISQDHGKKWEQIFKDEAIVAIYPHPFFNDMVFFLTPSKKVFYSTDRGKNIRSFNTPNEPNVDGYPIMNFHPNNKDWIIWIGARDCPGSECHAVASITTDRGDGDWKTLQRYVRKCEFIREPETGYLSLELAQKKIDVPENKREKLIYCEVRKRESNDLKDNPWRLVSSWDFFNDEPKVHFENVVDFATMSEFIVVATKDEEKSTLKVDASIDGATFAAADFPHGFNVDHQQGYTVLDSSTHSVFLHVTVNNEAGFEYGSIIKSNSNGTSYVMALDAVDRDSVGYVDFEKMFGIEGVAMVNVVSNYKDENFKKDGKKLKTMITHNDGAEWDYLPPPKADADGKKYECGSNIEKCALHIHGYTERSDKSHTYSSASAIGLMLGTGNVGEYLTTAKDADTFMTSDAGVNWKFVKKGTYMWEFGDQGSIVVIVKEREPTKDVFYSLDEGDTWISYPFSDTEVQIDDLTTVPSDNSRNFLLWGKSGDGKLVTFNLDFSGLTDQECKLDEGDVTGGDYYLWTPKHPKQDDECLFGHESQYHRKRTDRNCYNGRMIPHLHDIAKNCSCTRRDFECDFNYERQSEGSCALVSGLSPPDPQLVCKVDKDRIEYDDPTGYRRIPITTCVGGLEMDKSVSHPCPGKGDQFNKKHGLSGVAIFFIVIISVGVAAGFGYWVWMNWANKFGQIRLGEQSSFDQEAWYIKYPVAGIAGIITLAAAAPSIASTLWSSARNAFGGNKPARFTTRDSFARGRGDYAIVDEDEGELLGEESDEEV